MTPKTPDSVTSVPPSNPNPGASSKKPRKLTREEKLAAALKANIRRRKQAAKAADKQD